MSLRDSTTKTKKSVFLQEYEYDLQLLHLLLVVRFIILLLIIQDASYVQSPDALKYISTIKYLLIIPTKIWSNLQYYLCDS